MKDSDRLQRAYFRRLVLDKAGCSTYEIRAGVIICLCCGSFSYNQNDIKNKYCVFCGYFQSERVEKSLHREDSMNIHWEEFTHFAQTTVVRAGQWRGHWMMIQDITKQGVEEYLVTVGTGDVTLAIAPLPTLESCDAFVEFLFRAWGLGE